MSDTIKIKAPRKGIRVQQGPTTAVYFLQADGNVLETIITHAWPKPMLFARERRRFKHEMEM